VGLDLDGDLVAHVLTIITVIKISVQAGFAVVAQFSRHQLGGITSGN
jgi:hypothetical protein